MVSFNIIPKGDEVEILTKDGVKKIPASDLREFACIMCGKKVTLWKEDSEKAYCSSECFFEDHPSLAEPFGKVVSEFVLKRDKSHRRLKRK